MEQAVEARDVNERSPRREGANLCPKTPQRSLAVGLETRRVGGRRNEIGRLAVTGVPSSQTGSNLSDRILPQLLR